MVCLTTTCTQLSSLTLTAFNVISIINLFRCNYNPPSPSPPLPTALRYVFSGAARRATVTILHPDPATKAVRRLTRSSPSVQYVQGDPQSGHDLRRAGILKATSVLLFNTGWGEAESWQKDGELIKSVLVVRHELRAQGEDRLNECIILTELTDSENTCFIDPTRWWPEEGRRFSLSPIYASGSVFPNTLLETAVVQVRA